VFNLRSSVLFLLSASLLLSPAWSSRSHQAPTSGHAHRHAHAAAAAGSSEDQAPSRHGRASVKHTSAKASASASSKKRGKHGASSAESLGVLPTKRSHGQLSIGSERILQIQQALIREHYLDGEASGTWDSSTNAAMQKFQADQGWQTKLMPDSRALKKLGLGADYSNAINAKTSSFNDPPPTSTIPADRAAGFAAGSRAIQ
jgi:hypothetical protein